MARSFGLKLEVFVLIGKAQFIDKVWLHDFHIVVLFDVDLALSRRRFYFHPRHMALEIDHVCLLQSTLVTLHLLRVVFAGVGHHAVGFEVGNRATS